jgi:hypothetical protein
MASERILLVGRIVEGEMHYSISPVAAEEQPTDGALQATIDYAAELQELQDDIADREFWSRGEW